MSLGGDHIGIDEARWRGYVLAIASLMHSQNGCIQDAIVIFKRNLDMHFKGSEDCAICTNYTFDNLTKKVTLLLAYLIDHYR